MFRDRIVCSILNKRVQRRLLQEAGLTYTTALDITLAAETAEEDARRLQKHGSGTGKSLPEEERTVN